MGVGMIRKQLATTLGVFGLVVLSGCLPAVVQRTIVPNQSNPIRTVAVLPLVNSTNDVDAPAYVREQMIKQLEKYHYVIKAAKDSDQFLKDQMGVTLGAQLDMTTPQKLGETLGVDGVFYGSLDDFSHKVTGVYNVKRVRVRSKLVNCKTGQTVWRNGVGIKSVETVGAAGSLASAGAKLQDQQETGEELTPLFGEKIKTPWHDISSGGSSRGMGESFMKGIAEKIVSQASKAPLPQETSKAIELLLTGLVPGPGR